jgi:hypothetical protein
MRNEISVFCRVDIDDVLSELSEKELIELVKDRGYIVTKHKPVILPDEDVLDEVLEAIRERRYSDAVIVIERFRQPKWKDAETCERDHKLALSLRVDGSGE